MRADRLLSILLLLQSRGRMTARELSEHLEVSERTIYRDLDALSIAGVPVYGEHGPGGGYALLDSYRTDLTGMTETEVRTLFLSGVFAPLADLGLAEALEAALLKISAAMPESQREHAHRIRERLHLDTASWFYPPEPVPHLQTLQDACWHDERLHIEYFRWDGSQGERVVDPYALVCKANLWYLVASIGAEMRVYRVARIRTVTFTGEHFARPAEFDLPQFWEEFCRRFLENLSEYPVTLRVTRDFVPVLVRDWGRHVQQLIAATSTPPDSAHVTFDYIFETMEHARDVLLRFGSAVEVLAPAELRASILERARALVGLYDENP